jgi:hypothetical protein
MPNIVITEGLDTPWTLANTESNITATTDLESINLANQTVGTLAYTASQLFASLKTEKSNLDNIVDAIELINEEIALFPGKIAAWDTVEKTSISDNVLGKMQVPLVKNDFIAVNVPNIQAVLDGLTITDIGLKYALPGGFNGPPADFETSKVVVVSDRSKLDALIELTAIKPALDAANIQVNVNQIGYLFPTPVQISSGFGEYNYWRMTNAIIEGGTNPSVPGTHDQLVVYRDSDGKPISYKYFFMTFEDTLDLTNPWALPVRIYTLENVEVPSDRLLPFAVPKNRLELDSWRLTLDYPQNLIDATNSLLNNTGLPEGVTPPVTTLGPGVEKYYDSAIYTTNEFITGGSSTTATPNSQITTRGTYPPVLRADLDLSKMTKADVGKFFQKPGGDLIYYIVDVRDDGNVVYRQASEFAGEITKFIGKMTDDIKKALRGEYAEKQILLTQRGTDQTLFVTSITQRYATFSDMATNLLKTLVNFYNDLARNLRG